MQVSYAIGVAKPMGIYVTTYGTSRVNSNDSEIAKKIEERCLICALALLKRD